MTKTKFRLLIILVPLLIAGLGLLAMMHYKNKPKTAEEVEKDTTGGVNRVQVQDDSLEKVFPVGFPFALKDDKVIQKGESTNKGPSVQYTYIYETPRSHSELYKTYKDFFDKVKMKPVRSEDHANDFEIVLYQEGDLLTVRGITNATANTTMVTITLVRTK